METILLIIVALLVLSVLVVVHEFGHFIAAKIVGVWPEEFGIGLPPRVWGKKIGETIWSINALPLGGFVRLHGEVGNGEVPQPKRAFVNASKFARGFIAIAGVTMNFIFAIFAFATVFYFAGIPQGVKIDSVAPDSPAYTLGLKKDDILLSLNGKPIYQIMFFSREVSSNAGKNLKVTFEDSESKKIVSNNILLRRESPKGEGLLGISYLPQPARFVDSRGVGRFFVSLYYGALQTYDFSSLIVGEFGKMITQVTTGHVPQGLAGPLGVVGVTAQVAKQGVLDLLSFSAIISLNLALINLVPFPPLDGSRVVFLFVEAIVGRKKLPKFEEKVHMIGMYILLGLMLLLTIREVPKLLNSGSLSGFVDKLVK